jgi:hypothetical protein
MHITPGPASVPLPQKAFFPAGKKRQFDRRDEEVPVEDNREEDRGKVAGMATTFAVTQAAGSKSAGTVSEPARRSYVEGSYLRKTEIELSLSL